MKTKILSAIICFSILSGCEKSHNGCDCPPDGDQLVVLPQCIADKIEEIKSEPKRDPPAEVYQYHYKGNIVYYFSSYCCDIPSVLYDENCNVICNPDGGLVADGDGRCTDFFNTRKCEIFVWKDNR